MAVKICLDAGHYGKYNHSPVVSEYYESDMTWKLHLLLKKHLEAYGIEVITTRSRQATDMAVYSRGKASKGCDLFLSLHSNACGTESVDYPIVYAPLNGKGDEIAAKLAKCIESMMGTKQAGKTATRKGKSGDYYGVIRGAVAVGVVGLLVEHSFHTNTRATKWLLDESNLDKLAKTEAQVIAEHFGITAAGADPEMTAIAGRAVATAYQMETYIKAKNPDVSQSVLDMLPLYLSEGAVEGIRGDVAFAQSCLETGNFGFKGSAVTLEQNNFCGMGVTSNGMKGNSFDTPQHGIRAQIQHLKAYANDEALRVDCVDPRFKYVVRGVAPYVEWLGIPDNPSGKGWASGAGYGQKILNILAAVIATNGSSSAVETQPEAEAFKPYLVKITASELNVRKGPGTKYAVHTAVKRGGVYTIVAEERNGSTVWGKLKSGAGWICLSYTDKLEGKVR